jgi:tetratricopeptide (TPR) repeat protein
MARVGRALKAVRAWLGKAGNWLGNVGHWLGAVLLIALFVFVGWLTVRGPLGEYWAGQRYLGEFFILTVMMSVYVLTFLAYRAYRRHARLERLKEDLILLGVPEGKTDTLYGQAQSTSLYLLTITLATAFTAVGVGLFFWSSPTDLINANTLQAMRYGFLGGYVFSLQLIYRRYTTDDMQPAVYLYCAFAIATGLIFNLIAFEALQGIASQPVQQGIAGSQGAQQQVQPVTGIGAGLLAILAFSLGYFPNLAISWFNRISYRALGVGQNRMDELPLSLIDGISSFHEVRLRDNGVDNVQNLAAVDIVALLVNSSFSVQEVIDWVDQAILYLYLDTGTANSFRRAGLRSASDFKDRWESVKELSMAKTIADQLQSTVDRLDTLYGALVRGPNLHYVEPYWLVTQSRSDQSLRAVYNNVLERAADHYVDKELLNDLREELENLQLKMTRLGIQPPEPETARQSVGHGVLYEQDGKNDTAEAAYQAAIARDPKYPEAHNRLAWLYVNDEKTFGTKSNETLEQAKKAVELQRAQDSTSERYAAYLDTLATVQIKLNQLNDAEQSLQEASKVSNVSEAGRQYIGRHLKKVQELRKAGDKKSTE